jgi:hypothetical protein
VFHQREERGDLDVGCEVDGLEGVGVRRLGDVVDGGVRSLGEVVDAVVVVVVLVAIAGVSGSGVLGYWRPGLGYWSSGYLIPVLLDGNGWK